MKIKGFYTTSLFEGGKFDEDKPVCVFATPSVFMHIMRSLLDGETDDSPIVESKERAFVSRVNFELDGEDVELCGVLCDDQSFFMGVKTGELFSKAKTEEILSKLRQQKSDERNTYSFSGKYVENENCLSACDYNIANFNRFIEIVKEETAKGDTRPIYIFNFFDRLDEATDITPFIDALATLDRQVFVGVSNNYPFERFARDNVQVL